MIKSYQIFRDLVQLRWLLAFDLVKFVKLQDQVKHLLTQISIEFVLHKYIMSYITTTNTNNEKLDIYKNELKDIETNFNIISQALLKSYPEYKLYSNVSELENIHNNNLYNFQDLKQSFFLLKNKIKNSNKDIEIIIKEKNIQLDTLKNDNNKLTQKYNNMEESDQSSIELNEQFKDKYRQNYISSVVSILFALMVTFIGVKQFNYIKSQ